MKLSKRLLAFLLRRLRLLAVVICLVRILPRLCQQLTSTEAGFHVIILCNAGGDRGGYFPGTSRAAAFAANRSWGPAQVSMPCSAIK